MEKGKINNRKIFLSHSSSMNDTVELACIELKKHNVETWVDIKSIPKGKDGWIDAIDTGILIC